MSKPDYKLFEVVGFISTVILSKVFYTSTMMIIKITATAAWYTTIISCITSLIFFLLIYTFLKRFPGRNLLEAFEGTIGRIPGRTVSMLFAVYLMYYTGMNLREFVEIIKAITLPYTATSLIVTTFIITLIVMAHRGFEVIVRTAYFLFFVVIVGDLLIMFLAYPYYSIEYLAPIGGFGLKNSLMIGFTRCSAYDEIVLLAFFANSLKDIRSFKKAGVISLVIVGVILSTNIMCILMAFGYNIGGENLSNMYMLSRVIYFSRFFQRIDAIFIFTWVTSSVVTVGTAFYTALKIYSECFEIENHKPLIYPFAVLAFMAAMLPRDISEIIDAHMMIIKQYSFLLLFGVPVLMLLISLIFRRKGASNELKRV